MLNVDPIAHPNSTAAQRFLNEYTGQLGDQKLVVFALHAPYFLDATEMGHLTTYFGVYGKTQPFLEGAVRALFRSFTPAGAPPVNVPGTRFGDLGERLQPIPSAPDSTPRRRQCRRNDRPEHDRCRELR